MGNLFRDNSLTVQMPILFILEIIEDGYMVRYRELYATDCSRFVSIGVLFNHCSFNFDWQYNYKVTISFSEYYNDSNFKLEIHTVDYYISI